MNKYNWEEKVGNCKKNTFYPLYEVGYIKTRPLSDATKILYHGDLDKYFADVKGCEISNQFISILNDMYEEINQLKSIINNDKNSK